MSGVLSATLTKAVLYRRVSLTLRALLVAGAGASVALCALFAADNLVNLSVPVRTAFGLAFLLAGGTGLVRLYWRVWRAPIPVHRVAVYLEQRYGIADNRLINAVRFAQDESLPAPLLASFTAAAERTCATLDLRRIWQHARLRQALQLSGACLLLTLAYVIPFRAHARNALLRFLHPDTAPDPLAFTQFAVSPGDTERPEGGACAILARATRNGKPAARLDIVVDDGRGALLYPMRTTPGGMAFDLRDLTRDTRYAIRSGRDSSRWHTVRVRRRPKPEALTVTVTPPAYTGAKPWSLNADARESGILNGSRIAIRSGVPAARNPLFRLDGATHAAPDFAFVLQADCAVTLDLTDARGMTHPAVWSCRFTRVNDRPPEVRFLNRDLNVRAGFGDSLTLSLEWQDDYGVTALELYTLHEQREVPLKRLTFREVRRTRADVCALPVTREMFAPNARYRIRARVLDNHLPPQAGITATPVTLHVGDPGPAAVTGDPNDPHVRLFGTLTEALELQKPLRDWVAARIGADRRERVTPVLRARQEAVHQRILLGASLATDLLRQRQIRKTLADRIAELVTAHSEPLVSRIPALADLPDAPRQAALNTLVLRQTDLIGALQRILGLISQEKAEAELAARKLETAQQEQKMPERLEALKKGLEAFQEAERKLLTGLEAIDPREPEDWTEEEEKLLGDLAAKRQDFAAFLQAAFNDLSKVENQDFSNSILADELVEMIEELQKSGAALERKHIEIATVNEELLGQQAESITANLERWLADAKDFIKWNGEEGGVFPDVPLQDLPEELTDILGELIDDLADMSDVEDSTGSSLSAMDDGLGWGVSDGNMDNMSARGITGNVMPNNNEVGGRSGEGRSGKSAGQFVEKEATGKGGRNTPTRLVQSPFEKGTVRDHSKDPQGGATGGGKQSGLGGEGLRGITPDRKPDTGQRLPGQQAELRQRAEALLREMTTRNLPSSDLEEAIRRMALLEGVSPSAGQGLRVKQLQNAALASLKDARQVLRADAEGGSEIRAASAKPLSAIRYQGDEPTPGGYEESVDAYFRALAEPDNGE